MGAGRVTVRWPASVLGFADPPAAADASDRALDATGRRAGRRTGAARRPHRTGARRRRGRWIHEEVRPRRRRYSTRCSRRFTSVGSSAGATSPAGPSSSVNCPPVNMSCCGRRGGDHVSSRLPSMRPDRPVPGKCSAPPSPGPVRWCLSTHQDQPFGQTRDWHTADGGLPVAPSVASPAVGGALRWVGERRCRGVFVPVPLWLALPVRLVARAGGDGCGGPRLVPGAAGRGGCDSRGGCAGGGGAAGSCGVGVGPVGADGVGTGA
jgi:hypothetical protein